MHRTMSLAQRTARRLQRLLRRSTRYDLVLAIIPLAFAAAGLLGSVTTVPFSTAAGVASGVSLLALVDALFLNPPREPTAGPPSA